MIDNEIEIIT